MHAPRPILALLLAAALAGFTSRARASSLGVTIEPRFEGSPLLLDSLRYPTASGETVSFSRVSLLLGDIALEAEDGTWTGFPGLFAWIDSGARRLSFEIPQVPPGRYRSIRFHIGPDPETNAADPARHPAGHPLNPNLNGLHWSWQGGYIFLAVEGRWRGSQAQSDPSGFAHHLARDPNRTLVTLSAPLDLTRDAALSLHFDLARLFNAPHPVCHARDGSATHSRDGDPLAAALRANLPHAFLVHHSASTPSSLPRSGPPATPIDFPEHPTPHRFTMSRSFPLPDLPMDNPLITERVELGRRLFHDPALSRDQSLSCASCHLAEAAFTDRLPLSRGIGGRLGTRNSMPLANLAWKREFFWDGRAPSLRAQTLMPIQDHREMDASLPEIRARLARSTDYPALFQAAFRSGSISPQSISLALEQFLLTLSARDSRFDQAMAGKATLTESEWRGFQLFMTENDPRTGQLGADCFHCHGGALFTDHQFHHNGLPTSDPGRGAVTGRPSDLGKFATPSLRNVALTAPYMHDGRFATLEEVIQHYNSGVQPGPNLDPNLAKHPKGGLHLPSQDQAALVAFLKTLTDSSH